MTLLSTPTPAVNTANRLARYSGWYLLATGIIHNAIGLIAGGSILAGIHQDGWWNTIESAAGINFERSAIVWFLVLGFFWMLMGYLMQAWQRETRKPLPAIIGWGLLANGIWVAIMLPASGAWLVLLQGVILIWARRAT